MLPLIACSCAVVRIFLLYYFISSLVHFTFFSHSSYFAHADPINSSINTVISSLAFSILECQKNTFTNGSVIKFVLPYDAVISIRSKPVKLSTRQRDREGTPSPWPRKVQKEEAPQGPSRSSPVGPGQSPATPRTRS
jgi:hypothetical protein